MNGFHHFAGSGIILLVVMLCVCMNECSLTRSLDWLGSVPAFALVSIYLSIYLSIYHFVRTCSYLSLLIPCIEYARVRRILLVHPFMHPQDTLCSSKS